MTANNTKTIKKRKAPPKAWKPGQSGNPAGRPRDGESWAAIIKSVGDMYPTDILAFIGENNDLGRALKQYPSNVQMKYLVTARVFSALMFEPTSGLWKELMERAEGKVTDKVDLSNTDGSMRQGEIGVRLIDYRVGITDAENRPSADHSASSQDENIGDGA